MKLKDLAFIGAVVLLLAPFFLSNDLYAAYLACNASHPYLMPCSNSASFRLPAR